MGPEDNQNPYDANRGFTGIVLFPRTIGLTGEAIQTKKIVVLQEGDRVSHFASELDNMCNVDTLESMVSFPYSTKMTFSGESFNWLTRQVASAKSQSKTSE